MRTSEIVVDEKQGVSTDSDSGLLQQRVCLSRIASKGSRCLKIKQCSSCVSCGNELCHRGWLGDSKKADEGSV
jgi:hypothetical protein